MSNLQIAKTILEQIRDIDSRALMAWGANKYVGEADGEDAWGNKYLGALGFMVKGVKLKKGKVHIQLTPLDTYRLLFIDLDRRKWDDAEPLPPCQIIDNIYCDQLVEVIDQYVEGR